METNLGAFSLFCPVIHKSASIPNFATFAAVWGQKVTMPLKLENSNDKLMRVQVCLKWL